MILSPLTQCDLEELSIDMDVELLLEKLYEDEEGKEVISYKFKPRSCSYSIFGNVRIRAFVFV